MDADMIADTTPMTMIARTTPTTIVFPECISAR